MKLFSPMMIFLFILLSQPVLADIFSDYNGLVNDYNNLRDEYNGLINDYNNLRDEHNGLINDYNNLLNN